MLFLIFLTLLFVGVGMMLTISDDHIAMAAMSAGIFAIGLIGTIISVALLCVAYIGLDGDVERNQIRYDSLMYQYENCLYDNDNDVGKKELMSEIQSWNEDLAWYKTMQRNSWIGIYIPNVYDQFDFIELHE